jgi:hypothetical protein
MREPHTGPLSTIGIDRRHGVKAIRVYCEALHCGHSGDVGLDRLVLADDLPVIHIPRYRRFVCTRCGCRKVSVRALVQIARSAHIR